MTCQKSTYTSKRLARIALRTISKLKAGMRVYKCPHCSGWHLTSSQKAVPPSQSRHKPRITINGTRSRHSARTREEAEALARMLRARHHPPSEE